MKRRTLFSIALLMGLGIYGWYRQSPDDASPREENEETKPGIADASGHATSKEETLLKMAKYLEADPRLTMPEPEARYELTKNFDEWVETSGAHTQRAQILGRLRPENDEQKEVSQYLVLVSSQLRASQAGVESDLSESARIWEKTLRKTLIENDDLPELAAWAIERLNPSDLYLKQTLFGLLAEARVDPSEIAPLAQQEAARCRGLMALDPDKFSNDCAGLIVETMRYTPL